MFFQPPYFVFLGLEGTLLFFGCALSGLSELVTVIKDSQFLMVFSHDSAFGKILVIDLYLNLK